MASTDTAPEAAAVQQEIYRRMAPTARLEIGLELTELSRELLADGIRARHPHYTDGQVRLAMIRVWLGQETFNRAYPDAPEIEP